MIVCISGWILTHSAIMEWRKAHPELPDRPYCIGFPVHSNVMSVLDLAIRRVWLGFTICFVLNPLPMFARSSRYWFLKKFLTLFVSGLIPVEFSSKQKCHY
ncbi:uncharacterized protein EI90DRAFT_3081071 [Cantharellus anzutake]|uniref:uncharacterized protein n=1 Tax=Cantharellus anzutake TaxID=1750568 RepID=UPI001903299D|nr:uncharacterized protein EI90DRAFT_3081071 [Cantharellus anzutake]KAF8320220.1 hypothetical protein EI90DRAFT_3081071 [Cantharellus anzutake]